MPETTEATVRTGEILGDRYEVERVLGQGGMGVVVAARHLELGQRVALKFMLPQREAAPSSRERFLQEARAAVRLKSPHVAKVLDVGTLVRGGGQEHSPFIVMEYLDGRDLDAVLEERWPLPVGDAVEYLLHACEGVGEAHAIGIIHRDLKPANLFLTKNADGSPCVKVLDFGLSKLTSTAQLQASLTRTDSAMGTPHYMSPEQMRSAKQVDERSDIWALGAIAYELLTREVPFDGETVTELCAHVLEEVPRSPAALRDDLPEGLAAVVLKCLEKDPNNRWQSVAELAQALAPFAPARAAAYGDRVARVMAQARASSEAPPPRPIAPAASPGSVTGAVWRKRRQRTSPDWRILAVAAGLASLAVVVGFFLGRGKSSAAGPDGSAAVADTSPEQTAVSQTARATGQPAAQGVSPSVTSEVAAGTVGADSAGTVSPSVAPDGAAAPLPATSRGMMPSKDAGTKLGREAPPGASSTSPGSPPSKPPDTPW